MSDGFDGGPEVRSGLDRRRFLRLAMMGAAGAAAAGSIAELLDVPVSAAGEDAKLKSLVKAAKAEGTLNTIALPHTWSNYGTETTPGSMLGTFHKKYGLGIIQADPTDSSAQEIASIKALKGQSRAPDVVDVSPSIAETAVKTKLFTPYKVSTWSSIPSNMKDPKARWYGDYYGVISFGVNLSLVKHPPEDWADLKKPEYKGMVAINGNPTSAGDAFGAVFGAALANGGSLDDITPGIEFFKELKTIGNWNPTNCLPANIAKGTTPIAIEWDYLNIAYNAEFHGSPKLATVIPSTGKFGNFYCQAISAYAPHPAAAKLWEEFVYSDQGQLLYLKGYAHPARYTALAKEGKIPPSLAKKLPPASHYAGVHFPNAAQTTKAAAALGTGWATAMG